MTTLAARPEAITFAPHQSALIVVDMQNAYASQGGYLDLAGFDVSATRPVIENIQTAVNAARAAGMLIVWFQNGWDDQYVEAGGPGSPNFHKSNALKTMRKRPELQGTLLAKGSWDYQLVDELVPEAGDIVLPKPRYSGFLTPARQPAAQPGDPSSGLYRHRYQRLRGIHPARRLLPGIFWRGAGRRHPSGRAGVCAASGPVQHRNLFGWVSNVADFCDALNPPLARIA